MLDRLAARGSDMIQDTMYPTLHNVGIFTMCKSASNEIIQNELSNRMTG